MPDNNVLNAAIRLSLEWGEQFGKRIDDRLRAQCPALSDEEVAQYAQQSKEIQSAAFALMEESFLSTDDMPAAIERLRGAWPFLDDDTMHSLYSQGYYYAWRENGDRPGR